MYIYRFLLLLLLLFSLSFIVNRGEQLNSLRTVVETFCLFVFFFKSSLSSRKNSVCSKQETFFFLSSSSFLSYWCYIHTYTHCFYFFWLLDAALVSLPHTLSLFSLLLKYFGFLLIIFIKRVCVFFFFFFCGICQSNFVCFFLHFSLYVLIIKNLILNKKRKKVQ